jgi:hypothetical protein
MTMTPLRVLVTEAERGSAAIAVDELQAAGHEVLRCHPAGSQVFPCIALEDPSACPLHGGSVDVALDVRRHSHHIPSRREEGTICALRQHIPVVVAGGASIDPITDYAAEFVDTPYDVVEAVERAALGALPKHTELATLAVQEFANGRGIRAPFVVKVMRRHGGLVVVIRDHHNLDRAARQMLAVRVIAAVRSFDRESLGIDGAFDDAG